VQDDCTYAVEVHDDGARAWQDRGGAVEFPINYAYVTAGEPSFHLERSAVEVALLCGTVGVDDGGAQGLLL
jgi:hypothetical protein